MIPEIIKQWDKNKERLEYYFKTTPQSEYSDYEDIVKKIFELVINHDTHSDVWDVSKLTVIDHGDYQGTQLFIVPKDSYQPSAEDYLILDNYYGSCSGCDTLLGISSYLDDKPDEKQISEYMTLALHLVQSMRSLAWEEQYNPST